MSSRNENQQIGGARVRASIEDHNKNQQIGGARVRVFIKDHTGNKTREARLAIYAEINQLIPVLITALDLPVTDPRGRTITYHLVHNNRQLQRDETLKSTGISEGAQLTLVPESEGSTDDDQPAEDELEQQQFVEIIRELISNSPESESGRREINLEYVEKILQTSSRSVREKLIDLLTNREEIEEIEEIEERNVPLRETPARKACILHLSDLHLQTNDDAYLWHHQLAADLEELEVDHLDAVVISGDITNLSTGEEYNAAQVFIKKICDSPDLPISSERIVIVPGNHDLNWKKSREGYPLFWKQDYQEAIKTGEFEAISAKKHIEYGDIIALRHKELYQERFRYFKEFYDRIKAAEQYSLDYEQQYTLCICPEQRLLIVGFNSAWELDHYYRQRASIHPIALTNALKKIKENGGYSDYLKIAVWHHPLQSPFEDRIKDHTFIIEKLAQAGFRLALHGHIHRAETSLYSYDRTTNGRRVHLVAAGTFGAPIKAWIPGYPLQYNLLTIEGNQLIVNTRRRESHNESWKPDARWIQGRGENPLPYYNIDLS